jgi:CARDB
MRRIAVSLIALAALAAPASAVAAAGDAPRLRAVVSSCQTSLDAAARAAAFTASMPADGSTIRMAIRFDLQQRTIDGGVWQRVAAPSFGRWERSRPGVAGFVYTKDVHGLTAPGEYRAIVRFRWFADDGTVRTLRKVTRSCRQPDARPNLVAGRLQVVPLATPGLVVYQLAVRNAGRTPAGPFAVALDLDGAEAGRAAVAGLAPRAVTTVQILAASCAGGHAVDLRLDADGAIDEAVEDDGLVRPACPLSR